MLQATTESRHDQEQLGRLVIGVSGASREDLKPDGLTAGEPAGSPAGGQERRPPLPDTGDSGFVDLFSGAGGFTLGFMQASLRPLVSVDVSPKVRATHERNYPDVPFVLGDLSQASVQDRVAALAGSEPMVVAGGPPCQGFSIFGKRRFTHTKGHDPHSDPRNRLVFSFVTMVARLNPRWVVMENVPGFTSLDRGSFLAQVVKDLRDLGFHQLEYRVLDAANYGVPQTRRRFVLIANRTGHIIPWPKMKYFAQPKDWQRPFRTVGEVISDLADEASYSRFTSHVPMNHRPLQAEQFEQIPEGGKLDIEALPPDLRTGYRTETVKNYSQLFRRLHRDRPSFTLVPGHNAFPVHPWLNRALTAREAGASRRSPTTSSSSEPERTSASRWGTHSPLCWQNCSRTTL